jgi:penicillin-binding protein 1B
MYAADLAECAMLAGMIQRPSYFNPFRHPERRWSGATWCWTRWSRPAPSPKEQAERAKAEPLHLTPGSVDASEAPYFVDLVREQLVQKLGDRDFNREGLRIYTSLDPDLQRVATQAVDTTTTWSMSRWTSCMHEAKKAGRTDDMAITIRRWRWWR